MIRSTALATIALLSLSGCGMGEQAARDKTKKEMTEFYTQLEKDFAEQRRTATPLDESLVEEITLEFESTEPTGMLQYVDELGDNMVLEQPLPHTMTIKAKIEGSAASISLVPIDPEKMEEDIRFSCRALRNGTVIAEQIDAEKMATCAWDGILYSQ
ncbi:hypothetical protein HW450_10520 [Corynebacterium hindlerae]|uniref:Uncharacterized protein n=1 Tax=Corynebacterium hindlerae TaxID=699041 RepID=A0A7G5FDS2_9CORY|nr:hypothetical protein [Corynebacterium hindlerae]QMV84763.1 hypothetical protein HW450_10520 [Corynebacterium hindlerae]QTH59358.1 hypothetical protein J5O04_11230 [Corynebacterium hindlerae]